MIFGSRPYGSIITDGLVLNLDATNINSYPGSGTTWSDTSGRGNNGTLTNGPIFLQERGRGSIVFDGVNDYVSSFPTQISGVGSKTVCAFIYPTTSSRSGICGVRPAPITGSAGWVLTVNRTTPGNLTYFHTGGTTVEIAAGISNNIWCQVVATYSTVSATVTLYVNGSQIGSPVTGITAINSSTFNGVVGDEDGSFTTPFRGRISNVQIYNRALNATEVLQNYNALKSRFT